jgi:tetratricopeptide (TPR) repeat protein
LAAASGQLSQAVANLTKATELDPQHLEAFYQLGLACQKLGQRAKATEALKKFEQLKAIKSEPAQLQDADALLSLADTYYRLQKPEDAAQAVRKLSSLAEKDPQLRLHLGLLLIENEQASEGLRQLESARQQLPPSFALAFGLGSAYLQLQRPADATVSFQEAVRLKPDSRTYFYLGKAYAQLNDPRSIEALREAVTRDADSADAWELLGIQAFEHKALASVIPLFQQQAQRSSAEPLAHLWLGEAHLRNQDLPQALESFKRAVELAPQLARAQFSLGFAYKELGKTAPALEALRRAASLAPENPLTHFHLGELLSQADDQEAAVKELQRAVELKPDYSEAQVQLGQAYLKQKRYREAVETLLRGIALQPDVAQPYYILSRAYQGLEQGAQSAEALRRFQQLSQKSKAK